MNRACHVAPKEVWGEHILQPASPGGDVAEMLSKHARSGEGEAGWLCTLTAGWTEVTLASKFVTRVRLEVDGGRGNARAPARAR